MLLGVISGFISPAASPMSKGSVPGWANRAYAECRKYSLIKESYAEDLFQVLGVIIKKSVIQQKGRASQKDLELLQDQQEMLLVTFRLTSAKLNMLWEQRFKQELGCSRLSTYHELAKSCLCGYEGPGVLYNEEGWTTDFEMEVHIQDRMAELIQQHKNDQKVLRQQQKLEKQKRDEAQQKAALEAKIQEELQVERQRRNQELAVMRQQQRELIKSQQAEQERKLQEQQENIKWLSQAIVDGVSAEIDARETQVKKQENAEKQRQQQEFDRVQTANEKHAQVRQDAEKRAADRRVLALKTRDAFCAMRKCDEALQEEELIHQDFMTKLKQLEIAEFRKVLLSALQKRDTIIIAQEEQLTVQVAHVKRQEQELVDQKRKLVDQVALTNQFMTTVESAIGEIKTLAAQKQQEHQEALQRQVDQHETSAAEHKREFDMYQRSLQALRFENDRLHTDNTAQLQRWNLIIAALRARNAELERAANEQLSVQCCGCGATQSLQRCTLDCCRGGLAVINYTPRISRQNVSNQRVDRQATPSDDLSYVADNSFAAPDGAPPRSFSGEGQQPVGSARIVASLSNSVSQEESSKLQRYSHQPYAKI